MAAFGLVLRNEDGDMVAGSSNKFHCALDALIALLQRMQKHEVINVVVESDAQTYKIKDYLRSMDYS